MAVDKWRKSPEIVSIQAILPGRLCKYLLNGAQYWPKEFGEARGK